MPSGCFISSISLLLISAVSLADWTGLVDNSSCNVAQDHANMGFVIDDITDIRNIGSEQVHLIKAKLQANGVVVIKNQTLSRNDQVVLSGKLGKVIVIPPSFEGKDPEAGYPEIHRVTNFFHNGTWKGKSHCFGCYWHKDGNFQENGYLLSLLYADQVAENRSSTNFLDNCEVVTRLKKQTVKALSNTVFTVSVRDIPDFKNGTEEDYSLYPNKKRHHGIYRHPENGRECAYVTADLITDAGFSPQLRPLFEEVVKKSVKYTHFWQRGDIVIWDNLAVMHRAGTRGGGAGPTDRTPRMLYRTQSWLL